uniref:uncharacterized protein LOC114675491 n=1 Tax=Macaca mulatta TaxID=9544 RepID=UPI0010A27629
FYETNKAFTVLNRNTQTSVMSACRGSGPLTPFRVKGQQSAVTGQVVRQEGLRGSHPRRRIAQLCPERRGSRSGALLPRAGKALRPAEPRPQLDSAAPAPAPAPGRAAQGHPWVTTPSAPLQGGGHGALPHPPRTPRSAGLLLPALENAKLQAFLTPHCAPQKPQVPRDARDSSDPQMPRTPDLPQTPQLPRLPRLPRRLRGAGPRDGLWAGPRGDWPRPGYFVAPAPSALPRASSPAPGARQARAPGLKGSRRSGHDPAQDAELPDSAEGA